MCSQSLELQVVIPSVTRKKTADKKGRALKSVWCGRLVTLQPCKGCAAEKPCLACSLSGPITNHLVSRGCSLCLLQKKKKKTPSDRRERAHSQSDLFSFFCAQVSRSAAVRIGSPHVMPLHRRARLWASSAHHEADTCHEGSQDRMYSSLIALPSPPADQRKFWQALAHALALRAIQRAFFLDRLDGAADPPVPCEESFSRTVFRALLLVGCLFCCFFYLVSVCLQLLIDGFGHRL